MRIHPKREYIQFMLEDGPHRRYKETLRTNLGVVESDKSAQKFSMETLIPPGCARVGGSFPTPTSQTTLHRWVSLHVKPFATRGVRAHCIAEDNIAHRGQRRVLDEFAAVAASFTLDRRAVQVPRLLFE